MLPADAKYLPHGLKAIAKTEPRWPTKIRTLLPVSKFHMRTELSEDPVATYLSFAWIVTH